MLTPKSMSDGISSPDTKFEPDDGIDTENLRMGIQWLDGEPRYIKYIYSLKLSYYATEVRTKQQEPEESVGKQLPQDYVKDGGRVKDTQGD